MKKLSAPLLKRLRLAEAVTAEAAATRNLLPEEPAWNKVAARSDEIADFLANQLRAGFQPAPQVETAARKPGHGVRPVPYWGMLERVVYRALTTAALSGANTLDRSPQAYLQFVTAPGRYARDRQSSTQDNGANLMLFLGETPVNYVVKSDITAFYQFIDHAILAEELLLIGVDFELIEALMELLAQVQDRNYGLPQLFLASDMLSELYADKIERELLRSGFAVWRFNDDFRIACDTYADALASVEALDAAARRVGLVLSENKTVTVGIVNYVLDAFDLSTSESGIAVDVDNVEDIVGDYTDDFGEDDADGAFEVIRDAQVHPADTGPYATEDSWIDLRHLRTDDVRLLRRAINGLTMAADGRALDDVIRLAKYAPTLTPNLMRYIRRIGEETDLTGTTWNTIARTVDDLARNVALTAWQNLWLVDVIRHLALLSPALDDQAAADSRSEWVDDLRRDTASEALRAVATRALASQGRLPVADVIAIADRSSGALLHIYTAAANESAAFLTDHEATEAKRALRAWAQASKLHACLLADS